MDILFPFRLGENKIAAKRKLPWAPLSWEQVLISDGVMS